MKLRAYKPFLSPYKKAFLWTPLFVMIDVACEVSQPRLMSAVVDTGIMHRDISFILKTGIEMILLAVVAIAANFGNIFYSSRTSVGFASGIRKELFRKIQFFSFADTDYFSTASLTTRITNDTNILQQVLMMSMRLLFRGPLMLVFAVVFAVMIDRGLAMILLASIPLLALSIYFLLKRGLPYFMQMQQKVDQLNSAVQENLANVRVIKSFVRQDFEKEKFSVANDNLMRIASRASETVIMIMPVMQLIMGLSLVAVTWFGGLKVIGGHLQVGALMSFISYITQILVSLMLLSMTFMMISRAIASGDRIEEVLNKKPSLSDTADALQHNYTVGKGAVSFEKVYFSYNQGGTEPLLANINCTIPAGTMVAVIGATGSGKSSLIQLIPRLYDVNEGQICIDGINVQHYRLQELRSSIGIVLQQNQLFSGTIYDNLKWGNENATAKDIEEAARIACADDFIRSFPQGYDTILGQGGVNLSGGQKQRICIARALLKRPKILILDDSTSAVDTDTDRQIREGLRTHLAGTTVFMIAQRISSVMHADQILLMDNGQIIAAGTHERLLQSSKAYQEIYFSQKLPSLEI